MGRLAERGGTRGLFGEPIRSRGPTPVSGFEFDIDLAEEARRLRGFDTSSALGDDYAALRLAEAARDARREADRLLAAERAGRPIDTARLEELLQIAETGEKPKSPNLFFRVLGWLDRPAAVVRLGLADILGADESRGVEIKGSDYADIFLGRGRSLTERLGADVVGEDGRVSGSQLLKLAGIDESDNFIGKVGRGIAAFGAEVFTDPLTAIGTGAKGASVGARASLALRSIDDAARAGRAALKVDDAGRIVTRALEGVSDDFARRLGDEVAEEAVKIQTRMVDEAVESLPDLSGPLSKRELDEAGTGVLGALFRAPNRGDDLRAAVRETTKVDVAETALDEAVKVIVDRTANEIVPSVIAKDFAHPLLRDLADSAHGSNLLKGGVQLMSPLFRPTLSKLGIESAVVPGTRGLGKRLSRIMFGTSSTVANPTTVKKGLIPIRRSLEAGLLRGVYTRWEDLTRKWSRDSFWKGVARGEVPAATVLRLQQDLVQIAADIGGGQALDELNSLARQIADQFDAGGLSRAELEDVMATMGSVVETGALTTVDELVSHLANRLGRSASTLPREAMETVYEYATRFKRAMDDLTPQAREAGLIEGTLANYVPHVLRGEMRTFLDDVVRLEATVTGDTVGDQMLRQIIENHKLQRGVDTGATVLGETRFAQERIVGRTAIEGQGQVVIPAVVGDTVLIGRSFDAASLTVDQLNDELLDAMQRMVDDTVGLKVPKLKDSPRSTFTPYDTNALRTAHIYIRDVSAAILERKMVARLKDAGLISDGVRYVNQQRLAAELAGRVGKYGREAVDQARAKHGAFLEEKLDALKTLRSIDDGPVKTVEVAPGLKIDIPESVLEQNKRLAEKVAKMESDTAVAAEVSRRARAFFEDTKRGLLKQGVPEDVADRMALSWSTRELRDILKETRATLRQQALDEVSTMKTALATADLNLDTAKRVLLEVQADWSRRLSALDEQRRALNSVFRDAQVASQVGTTEATIHTTQALQPVAREVADRWSINLSRLADQIEETGNPQAAELVREMSFRVHDDPSLIPAAAWEEVEGQIRLAAEVYEQADVFTLTQQRRRVKQATEFINDNFDEADSYLATGQHSGTWQPSDVRYVYHGSTNTGAFESLQRAEWYGGGISSSPFRSRNYSVRRGGGTVSVWRVSDFGAEAEALLRTGVDIEDAETLVALWRQGGGSGPLPAPVATFEQDVWQEALRLKRGPDPRGFAVAEEAGVEQWWTLIDDPVREVFDNDLAVAIEWYRDVLRGADEQTLRAEGEAMGRLAGVADDEGVRLVTDLDRTVKQGTDRYRSAFDFSDLSDDAAPYQADPIRQAILSHWRDKHLPATGVRPDVVPVGTPLRADWLPGEEDVGRLTPGQRSPQTISHPYTSLVDNETDAANLWLRQQRAIGRFETLRETDRYGEALADFQRPLNVDRTYAGLEGRSEIPSEELDVFFDPASLEVVREDLVEASRHSLVARGLGDEFPVWVKSFDEETGMSMVSLSPIDDAEVFLLGRDAVQVDFGIFQVAGRPATDMRDVLLVDAARLNQPLASASEFAKAGRALPSKAQLHQLRPGTMTREWMRQFFPTDEAADVAYFDLMDRLSFMWSSAKHSDRERFALLLSSQPERRQLAATPMLASHDPIMQLGRDLAEDGPYLGALEMYRRGIEAIQSDVTPNVEMFDVFARSDVQEWFAREVSETLGQSVQYRQLWLRGEQVVSRGTEGAVRMTVPVLADSAEIASQTLSRAQFERALDAAGVSAATARNHVRWVDEFADEEAAEQAGKLARWREAKQFVDHVDPQLVSTLRGLTDEVTTEFDRYVDNLASVKAERVGRNRDMDSLLGTQRSVDVQPTESLAASIVDELERATGAQSPILSVTNPRTGRQETSGVVVGAWSETALRVSVPPTGADVDFFASLRDDVVQWIQQQHDDLARGRARVLAYRDGDEFVVELATNPSTRAEAQTRGILTDTNVAFNARTGETLNIPKTPRAAKRELKMAQRDREALEVLNEIESALRGNNTAAARAALETPEKLRRLKAAMDPIDFDMLADYVKTERLIKERIVPQIESIRAQRTFLRGMADRQDAYDTVITMTDDASNAVAAATTEEIEALYQAELRFAEIMGEIMGVGPTRPGGPLRDESLYPRVSKVTDIEDPSEALIALGREAETIAKELGWSKEARAIKETFDNPPWEVLPPQGRAQHNVRVFSLGGTVTDYATTDIWTAGLLENMVRHWQVLATPRGMGLFANEARWIARAWKSMATVARPNFHTRNLIGGMWNNQIADVGLTHYAWVRHRMLKLRRLQDKGVPFEEILTKFPERDRVILQAMHDQRVLDLGFGATEFGRIGLPLDKSLGARARRAANIGDPQNPLTRAGGVAMRSIEDFLRASAFVRWYDELGAEGAAAMVRGIHFDYTDLSRFDVRAKRWIPFWIWSKNNIPLQARAAFERPDLLAKYSHLMHTIDDGFEGDHDNWPVSPFLGDLAADTGFEINGGKDTWVRLVFDPDLPIRDLEVFENPLSLDTWFSLVTNLAGPHVTSPFSFAEQQEFGQTNAPTGLNEILKLLTAVGLYDGVVSDEGDVQVGFGSKNLFNTAFPILNEFTQIAGLVNDPNQQTQLGIIPEDGISIGERLRGAGLQLARGLGLRPSTSKDARTAAFTASERVREIVRELKLAGILTPEDFDRRRAPRAPQRRRRRERSIPS